MILMFKSLTKEVKNKYRLENNTLFRVVKQDEKEKIKIEVGDSKQPDFKPQFKIIKFDEVNFSVRAEECENPTIEFEKEKIKYIAPDYEVHQYRKVKPDEEEFEFEWVLPKKPKSNILKATIQAKGVEFYKQEELSEERKKLGHERPEEIVGSYVIYMSKRKKNFVGGKRYGVGKIGYILKPKAKDAKGNEVWGEINIEKGVLFVTVPQKFLDEAVYPVVVDPTFGYGTVGGTSANCTSSYKPFCELYNQYEAVTGDFITGFSVYSKKVTNTANLELAAYSINSSNDPVSRLAAAVTVSVNSTTAQWWTVTGLTQALTNGVIYGAAVGGWSGSPANNNVYYDDVAGDNSSYHNATGSLPATWSEQTVFTSIVSIYAIYQHAATTIKYAYNIFIDKGKL